MGRPLLGPLALCACCACASEVAPAEVSRIERLILEVDYADGARPEYRTTRRGPTWGLYRANAAHLAPDAELVLPTGPDGMSAIGPVSGASAPDQLDEAEIVALAEAHRTHRAERGEVVVHALWLDAFYVEGGERQEELLGRALEGSGVVALFKPALERARAADPEGGLELLEQVVLLHAMGHALGLVDDGVPMVRPHLDEDGHHCTNPRCLMHRDVHLEGPELRWFVRQWASDSEATLFGGECREDLRAR
jgi:hypothetical protein